MGAWGHEVFQSDSALDWLSSAETRGSAALNDVFADSNGEYLDADVGSAVVAAASVVAAALDGNTVNLPAAGVALARKLELSPALCQAAASALDAVLGERSELRSLWFEGADGPAWREILVALRTRLLVHR
jgi:hypothetical protein